MNKYYADFNSDPLFLKGEANKKTAKAQIANNNALLQQQKKGGMSAVGNMSKQTKQNSNLSPLGSIASIDSNQNLTVYDQQKWQNHMRDYVPISSWQKAQAQQPSGLTQSDDQDIMKADRKALHQKLFKQSEDMLGRWFEEGFDGRETQNYLLQNIPQQEEEQDESPAEQEYAFWEGFNYNDEDALRELEREKSRYHADLNKGLEFVNAVEGVTQNVIIEPYLLAKDMENSEKKVKNIQESDLLEPKLSRKELSKSLLKNTLKKSIPGSVITATDKYLSYQELENIEKSYGKESREYRIKEKQIFAENVLDGAAAGASVIATGTMFTPISLATRVGAMAVSLGTVLLTPFTDDWAEWQVDKEIAKETAESLLQDEEFCNGIAKAVQLYGEDAVISALSQPIIEELSRI